MCGQDINWLGPSPAGEQQKQNVICTALKCKKNEIGTSFSFWDANGDKFVILASSGLGTLKIVLLGEK